MALVSGGSANELEDVRAKMRQGQYEEAIEAAFIQVEKRVWNEAWPRLLIEGYLTQGKYSEALAVYERAIERFGDSLRLRLLGAQVYHFNNEPVKASRQLDDIEGMLQRSPWKYSNRNDLIPLGEFFLLRGEDPKQVLKICYDQAIQLNPKNAEAHVATARMALAKNDAQVAAQAIEQALRLEQNDPEIYYLASRAWSGSDSEKQSSYLKQSLQTNPKFIPSLLFAAESQMDSEQYGVAKELLDEVEAVNPKHPTMWALRAAMAHLLGDFEREGNARRHALEAWSLNPEVDHTIGKHLSLHYRFREGSAYQRRALAMDANYAPARAQLAQDLLRLGETDEGWGLVDGVRKSDPYDVSIFNLKQLQAKLERFATLEIPGFVIRMDAVEAKVYGGEVKQLLSQARETLVQKYGVQLEEPIFVEIFPRQQEFAIRTFGLPGGAGFLGVCFGRLITANSPAALRVDSSWQSVLWHEYCHVVTLQKTKNKMPRWLSEGISVYEERARDSAWGERLDPTYREMLLSDDLVPISRLSGSFLQPKSPLHLQFAYYTSSLAVEFWIERFELKGLQRLLDDLAVGMRPEEALKRLPGSLDALDQEFLEFARQKALAWNPETDFTKPNPEELAALDDWLAEHPRSYWGWRERMAKRIAENRWDEALQAGQVLKELWPQDNSELGVYDALATIQRKLGNADGEREALGQLVEFAAAPRAGLLRLIEIDTQREDWPNVLRWSERLQGIAPLQSELQWSRSNAAEMVGEHRTAIAALEALSAMDPIDPSLVQFRLAKNLHAIGQQAEAKRCCLLALEESPRFREALELLVALQSP